MPCQKCIAYISDTLRFPPHPSSQHSAHFKPKRLSACLETISYILTRHIESSRSDLFEWLNMMEMMNCAVLNQKASRDYRMYQIWANGNSDVHYIILLLVENSILAKCQNKFIYEEWFAEKAMALLSTIHQIHLEHSGPVQVVEQQASDDLYS